MPNDLFGNISAAAARVKGAAQRFLRGNNAADNLGARLFWGAAA